MTTPPPRAGQHAPRIREAVCGEGDPTVAPGHVGAETQPSGVAGGSGLELFLNIPAFRLDVFERGSRTQNYRVAVGTPEYRTLRGRFEITHVVWNPWWYPPDREWARDEKVTPPGPANPMGRVKLHFGELDFIHGTPETVTLGTAASHGCVRLSNPDAIALARVVHSYASPEVLRDEVDELERDPRRTRTIDLSTPVPFLVVYDVAEVREGMLWLYPDVYHLAGRSTLERALVALERAGYDPSLVEGCRLEQLAERAALEAVSYPVEALLGPAAACSVGG